MASMRSVHAAGFLLIVGWLSSAEAASPVWKVTGPSGVGTVYVGGSVHALRRSDYPLPKAFDQAMDASGRLVLEVGDDPAIARKIAKTGQYPTGDSLKNHVDPRTYA